MLKLVFQLEEQIPRVRSPLGLPLVTLHAHLHISRHVLADTQVAWMQLQHMLPLVPLVVWLTEGSTQESG